MTIVPDGNNVVQYVSRILLFATPVIYPVSLLPPAAKAVIPASTWAARVGSLEAAAMRRSIVSRLLHALDGNAETS